MKKSRKPKTRPYSKISQHDLQKGKLISPANKAFSGLSTWLSWQNEGLHEMLWAVIIRGNTEQKESIELFRSIILNSKHNITKPKDNFITHSALSTMLDSEFDLWCKPIVSNEKYKSLLSYLLLFESLPDRAHWARHLDQPDEDISPLMRGVASCLDHQSQESTDIRWLKLAHLMLVGDRITFALPDQEQSRDKVKQIIDYPYYGDQTIVRPSIRAAEISFRGRFQDSQAPNEIPPSISDLIPQPWGEAFWKECLKNTPCLLTPQKKFDEKNSEYIDQFIKLFRDISVHFNETTENTSVDAKHDGSFGISLYAVNLAIGLEHVSTRAEGRIILRSIVESYITLKYLYFKNDENLWLQFRTHGSGQSKLAFLKNIDVDECPDFIKISELENYANEDIWMEFLDINIKPWSEKNLRSMAIECGEKAFYDKYYDWSSNYVHGQWGSIRDTIFTICANPLHRFHRIPFVPRTSMPNLMGDAARILNSIAEVVSFMYPKFTSRIKHPIKYGFKVKKP